MESVEKYDGFSNRVERRDTSMSKSSIVLKLFYRVDTERLHFCVENDLMPPGGMRQKKLIAWIDRRMKGDKRTRPKKIRLPLGQLELPLAA
jgi:hypothetical protein